MLEFWIADLKSMESQFQIPCATSVWEFHRRDDYETMVSNLREGQCAPTFYASNNSVTPAISDADFNAVTDELIDACLVLSFLKAACITPKGTTAGSDVLFAQLGDDFIRPRAIVGFPELQVGVSLNDCFSVGMPAISAAFASRRLRLLLSHWISGLTCFSMEDLFLSVGVQMDIIKQCEIAAAGTHLTYYDGMLSASARFGITPLGTDYKNMRNDIVHEGVLSGSNFPLRSKLQCAGVIADTLNWLDAYVSAVLSLKTNTPRWRDADIVSGLPALTV